MNEKTLKYLEENQSQKPSHWRKEAEWRRANASWLLQSQRIATMILLRMKELGLTQKVLAQQLDCSQQYISKILHGRENMSLEFITKVQETLDIKILATEMV